MPAKSEAQRRLMAIAEHNPDKVYPKNRGILGMSKKSLHDFASTTEDTLVDRVKKAKGIRQKK